MDLFPVCILFGSFLRETVALASAHAAIWLACLPRAWLHPPSPDDIRYSGPHAESFSPWSYSCSTFVFIKAGKCRWIIPANRVKEVFNCNIL